MEFSQNNLIILFIQLFIDIIYTIIYYLNESKYKTIIYLYKNKYFFNDVQI